MVRAGKPGDVSDLLIITGPLRHVAKFILGASRSDCTAYEEMKQIVLNLAYTPVRDIRSYPKAASRGQLLGSYFCLK